MNFVEPIRDPRKIAQVKNLLRGQQRYRDLLLFTVGINSALRISDLLPLKVFDFVTETGEIRPRFTICEEKHNKRNVITINSAIQEALRLYIPFYSGILKPENYIFFRARLSVHPYNEPLGYKRAWQLISQVCHEVGLIGNYGTHTLRKTWAYHARLAGVPMELIMNKLNHDSFAATKRYIGVTDDEIE